MQPKTTVGDMRCILFYLQQKEQEVNEGRALPKDAGIDTESFYIRPVHALLSDELIEVRGRDEDERFYLTPKGRAVDVSLNGQPPNLGGCDEEG